MKKKLLLTFAIVAVLTGGYFQSKAAQNAIPECQGEDFRICDWKIVYGKWVPMYGDWSY
jgi:hypothetical protein